MLESRLVGHTYTTDTKNEALGRIPFRDHPMQWEYQKTISMASKEIHAHKSRRFLRRFFGRNRTTKWFNSYRRCDASD